MAYYRLYFLDGPKGHIHEFREFEADDDLAALARAAAWRSVTPMELWCGARKVRRWEAIVPLHPRLRTSSQLRASRGTR
jgi:hypothetical protein